MIRSLLALVCAVAIAGCGSSDVSRPAGPKSVYLSLEKQLVKGDAVACESMTTEYKNKLAASVQLFSADCPAVVKEVGKGLREDPELRTRSIDDIEVRGNNATLIAHSTYRGADVRTKVSFRRSPGGAWLVDRDHELDDVAPSAPLTAYREYATAFSKGDGPEACALSTTRGKSLIAKALPQSHGDGSCEGAVPFLAVTASKLPEADVVGGEQKGDTATLFTLQSNGSGSWAFREVVMKREDGKWLFDHSRDLGIAPAQKAPSGPVT